tara:strand:+ start:1606 stop:2784 length:1179 start_codon:yes stop_codon:yes gene_type:complete
MESRRVVIVSAKRTPIGSFMGSLSNIPATELGAIVIRALIEDSGINSNHIDEVLMGNVIQAGTGQAPAKQASIIARIPESVPCTTVNKVCASGMKAISQGAQAIALGDAEIIIAGGMENMSQAPHLIYMRNQMKFGDSKLTDSIQKDGLQDPYDKVAMGVFADETAKKYKITREEQDLFALTSYERSEKAWNQGKFNKEVIPVSVPFLKGENKLFFIDEEFKKVIKDKIPNLSPSFSKEGTVTAANASTINDGAAAVLLMSEEKAKEMGINPLAYVESYADASHEPKWFTTAPSKSLPIALERASLSIDQIDLFEFNEAFSVVGLVNMKILNLDYKKVNINGGAVSLGHPLGCSGARIIVTLIHALKKKGDLGAASICNGGGGASSLIIKKG